MQVTFGESAIVPDDFELRSDHGSVYTGADCEQLCDEWKVNHTFSPVGRPTGNAVAERVIQTILRPSGGASFTTQRALLLGEQTALGRAA